MLLQQSAPESMSADVLAVAAGNLEVYLHRTALGAGALSADDRLWAQVKVCPCTQQKTDAGCS